jgi:GDP-4-dehydro-6-deoxy-D-mannose reductase
MAQPETDTRAETPTAEGVWLVTGATGFLGRHLLAELRERPEPGVEVVAMGRRRPPDWPRAAFFEADLVDPWSVACAIRSARPSVVFHLAGKTPPASALELYYANTVATALLLEALRERDRPARLVLAGSAAELGPVDEANLPVGEGHPCRPRDAYGLSKWLATTAALAARPPVEAVVGRIFNPLGPGTPENQALGRFAARLADASCTELVVGNLDTRRDIIDVRDAARALVALAQRGRAGQVYHIGTGRSHGVRAGLDHLLACCGRPVRIETDDGLAAHAGPRDSRADIGRISRDTGWTPQISWGQSLDDLWAEALRSHALRSAEPGVGFSPCA